MHTEPTTPRPDAGRHRLPALLLALAMALTAVVAPRAPATAQATDCTTAVPSDDIVAGMEGTGLTVERGTVPDPFDATVLGVLRNGIAPGLDLIVAELDAPAIERAGVWSGMSGSPVYAADGRLIGAVAYAFSWTPSPIAGLVPGDRVLELYDHPDALDGMATRVSVPGAMLAGADLGAGAPASALALERGATMRQLQLPVAVSGLRDDRLETVREHLGLGDRVAVTRSGSSSGSDAVDEIVPGGNFAAAMSFGDVTMAGVGTTTDVCDGRALAFGHPFRLTGTAHMSVHAAESLLVHVDDVRGSFKMANIGGLAGRLDQDRFAGIRGLLGREPTTTAFSSRVRSNASGRSGTSTTQIVDSDLVGFVSAIAMLSHVDVTADRIGGGHLWYRWTVSGTTADGSPFTVSRANRVADRRDASYRAMFDLWRWLEKLERNPHAELRLEDISVRARIGDEFQQRDLTDMLVGVNGGRLRSVEAIKRLRVRPGDELRVVVVAEQVAGAPRSHRSSFDLVVPRRLAGERVRLEALGGRSLADAWRLQDSDDLPGMLQAIESHPSASDVQLQWRQRRHEGRGFDVVGSRTASTNRVTSGQLGLPVVVRG